MGFAADYQRAVLDSIRKIDTAKVEEAIQCFARALDEDRQIFVCGNGGSAATAAHFVCDVVKGASYGRHKRFRIYSLCDSTPTLTAYANDVSYEDLFAEQLKNFARPGDVVVAISGSGNSPNVVNAIEYANTAGCKTITLTGRDGGKLGRLGQLDMRVPVEHMGRIEDAHMVICHMIAYRFMEAAG